MNVLRWRELIFVSFRLCLIELWSNRTRSFITSFGIFLGVASLLVNIAFVRALDNNVASSMERIGGLNIVTIRTRDAETALDHIDFQRSGGLRLRDAVELQERFSFIKSVLPQAEPDWGQVRARGKRSRARILAVGLDYVRAYNLEVRQGRPLYDEDHERRSSNCLIGSRVANQLFGKNSSPLGRQITMNGTPFTVVGLIHTDNDFSYRARLVVFPWSLYTHRFAAANRPMEDIAIELTHSDQIDKAVVMMRSALIAMHRGTEDFDIEANQTRIAEMRATSAGMRILLISIAIITLAVGAISIMNIMFATIGDRVREIGIRKALGAQPKDIFAQFVIEAVALSFVGGLPGIFLGALITFFPKGFFPFNPSLSIPDYIIAVGFTSIAGMISGIFPAFNAARMEPVDAMRY